MGRSKVFHTFTGFRTTLYVINIIAQYIDIENYDHYHNDNAKMAMDVGLAEVCLNYSVVFKILSFCFLSLCVKKVHISETTSSEELQNEEVVGIKIYY